MKLLDTNQLAFLGDVTSALSLSQCDKLTLTMENNVVNVALLRNFRFERVLNDGIYVMSNLTL